MYKEKKGYYKKGFYSFVITVFSIIIFYLFMFYSLAYGKVKINVDLIGRYGYGGDMQCVEIFRHNTPEGNSMYSFCGTNVGLLIIDATDPDNVKEAAFLESGEVFDIAFYNQAHGANKYALLANGYNGLSILNITDVDFHINPA